MLLSYEWPGISGTVLEWFTSYLSNRFQRVSVDCVLSDEFKVNFICLSVCLSVCPSVRPSVCLSVCLYIDIPSYNICHIYIYIYIYNICWIMKYLTRQATESLYSKLMRLLLIEILYFIDILTRILLNCSVFRM